MPKYSASSIKGTTMDNEKKSKILFKAKYFIRELTGEFPKRTAHNKGLQKVMYYPFLHKSNADKKWEELKSGNCTFYTKIAWVDSMQAKLDIPSTDGDFYLNAYSDPFSYEGHYSTARELSRRWAECLAMGVDYAALYQASIQT